MRPHDRPPDYTPKDLDPNYFLLGRTPHSVNIFFYNLVDGKGGIIPVIRVSA